MWASIVGLVASLVPALIKIVLYVIEKKKNSDEIRDELLKFIINTEKDIPIKLNDKYREQLESLKDKLKKENEMLAKLKEEVK